MALVAATLGFLPFNFPKRASSSATSGAAHLGFALALLVVTQWGATPHRRLPVGLAALGVPVDAGLTLPVGCCAANPGGNRTLLHAYQRWARHAVARGVTCGYAAWTAGVDVLMAWRCKGTGLYRCRWTVAWYIAGTGIWWLLQGKGVQVEGTTR